MNYANAISKVLEYSKLTVAQLAEKSGVSESDINSIVDNDCRSMAVIEAIAKGFNVPKSVICILGIEAGDVTPGKREIFKALKPAIDSMIGMILLGILAAFALKKLAPGGGAHPERGIAKACDPLPPLSLHRVGPRGGRTANLVPASSHAGPSLVRQPGPWLFPQRSGRRRSEVR